MIQVIIANMIIIASVWLVYDALETITDGGEK